MSSSTRRAAVVGGGVIGLCSAYYLRQAGFEVTVLDVDRGNHVRTSTGNAGMIVPSHFMPLANRDMLRAGIKMMLNPRAPVGFRFTLRRDQIEWLLAFVRSARHARPSRVLLNLNLRSKALYHELEASLGSFGLGEGLLMACGTESTLSHESGLAERAVAWGSKAENLNGSDLHKLEPAFATNLAGGVYYADDAFLDPDMFRRRLLDRLLADGVQMLNGRVLAQDHLDVRVKSIEVTGDGASDAVKILEADVFVFAAGAATPALCRKSGVRLPVVAGKGYGFRASAEPGGPKLSAILVEPRATVTPNGQWARFTGCMEIGAENERISPFRFKSMLGAIPRYLPAYDVVRLAGAESPWVGFRPMSADGLPIVGALGGIENVIVATGHGMMGQSLGPITGKIVADLASENVLDEDSASLTPIRFSKVR